MLTSQSLLDLDKDKNNKRYACIVSYSRTPIGSYYGGLSNFSAHDLDQIVIKTIEAAGQQNPVKLVLLNARLPLSVIITTINKVCSSGMKSIELSVQKIEDIKYELTIYGYMECMTNAPFILNIPRQLIREAQFTPKSSPETTSNTITTKLAQKILDQIQM
ncbi:MAG: Acetyl-CoA acetyltransferase [Streblomastix strix]|uniref:Acetyl-CoA acetyltransferase n=1 Tax=Streblomastix strix TaxID=222440 RepID=A0A5J4UZW6_9EUKA|nr:MAG: Acetyl-CoA acetyltransferase [Streblomastix strix]